MTLVVAAVIGMLFGLGVYLMLERDLIRNVAGLVAVSHAMNLLLMASGHLRGAVPYLPAPSGGSREFSDPVSQALTLTALVITFALTNLLFAVVYRTFEAHASVDQGDLFELELESLRDESIDDEEEGDS